jgi:hypothetical protein
MTGPQHFRHAEQLAAKAAEYLGHGDGQDAAAVWAAVAQTHAILALAAVLQPSSPYVQTEVIERQPSRQS